jgi:molybdenum cofactor guanylyltransferase
MKSIIVLCGGLSTRMGQDKGSMNYNNEPMIVHVLKTVKKVADEVILVLRDKNQCQIYKKLLDEYKLLNMDGLKICSDIVKDQGPLEGILTGLKQIKSINAMVIPCDSPFISSSFLNKIFDISIMHKDYEAYVPRLVNGKLEPLHSIYSKNSINLIEKLIDEDIRSVRTLISQLKVKYIDIEKLDITGKSFINLNSYEDISNIQK